METNRTRVTRKSCSCFALILNVNRDVIKIRASEVGKQFFRFYNSVFRYLLYMYILYQVYFITLNNLITTNATHKLFT